MVMITETLLMLNLLMSGIPVSDVGTMVCIARAESRLSPEKINHHNRNHTKDYGLFQINTIWLGACNLNTKTALDTQKNIECAQYVYTKQGLTAWSTYKFCATIKVEPKKKTHKHKH